MQYTIKRCLMEKHKKYTVKGICCVPLAIIFQSYMIWVKFPSIEPDWQLTKM